ncbi:bile acid:sodium symporter [soil metagenome]
MQPPISTFQAIRNLASKAGLDWFLLALLGMIGLAYVFPAPGIYEGPVSLGSITTYGVSLIFFFYGLKLSPDKLRAGLKNWRLHVTIHTATFIVFPILIYSSRSLFPDADHNMIWLGIFFLATLPSTVSSSVVMVSIAGGNIPAAIFNASISSLIGVFITPLWMGLVLTATNNNYDMGDIILKLTLQVALPVAIGILLHKRLGGMAEKYRMKLRYFDQIIILLIIYTSFCHSFALDMFAGFSATDLFLLAAGMLGLFFTVYIIVGLVSKALGFNREDKITAQFCGSKKSLVHGTVMSKVLFPDGDITGIILLPLMMYHALQLLVCGVIAQGLAAQSTVDSRRSTVK